MEKEPARPRRVEDKLLIGATVAAMFAAYAAYSWLCPLMTDDFNFWVQYRTASGGSLSPDWAALWAYVRGVWLGENGRLANMLCAPAVLWVPRWLWSACVAAMMVAIYLLSARIARGSWRFSPLLLAAVWVAGVVLLPWHDDVSLIPVDIALNYLLSALLLLIVVLGGWRVGRRRVGLLRYVALLVAGFMAGMCHEGESLPLLAAMSVVAVIGRGALPGQWWGLYAAVAAGAALCAGSPAIWERLFCAAGGSAFSPRAVVRALVMNNTLFAASAAIMAGAACFRKGREALRSVFADRMNLFLGLTAAFGAVMVALLLAPGKASIWSILLLTVLWLRVARSMVAWRPKPLAANVAAAAALLLAATFYAAMLPWQKKIYDEHAEIMAALRAAGPDSTLFRDTIRQTPWWTLGQPIDGVWLHISQVVNVNLLLGRSAEGVAPVLPTLLRDYDYANPVGVGVGDTPCYQAGDMILFRKSELPDSAGVANGYRFTLADGSVVGSYVTLLPHRVGGEAWLVGIPAKSSVKGPFREVVAVR